MEYTMNIRKETASDIEAITEVTRLAFLDHPVSRQTEQFIIHALREAGALSLSLVAEVDGKVVGHIAFSPVTVSDGTADWYGVGPLSVLPEFQRQGIGTSLVNLGVALLKGMGGRGCALVGDPGYYRCFGFRNDPGLIFEGIPQEYFMVLPFDGHIPQGTIMFHEAFLATS
jgi:putative acetyltransferase